MIPLPNLPLDNQTLQRLLAYFDSIGALLWDGNQKRSFAMYALGLLSPLKRKSVEPIAAHFTSDVDQADAIHQRLLNFLTDAPWPDDAVRLVAAGYGLSAMVHHAPVQAWIFDDTGFLKQGEHSVGVQRQYTGTAGKVASTMRAATGAAGAHSTLGSVAEAVPAPGVHPGRSVDAVVSPLTPLASDRARRGSQRFTRASGPRGDPSAWSEDLGFKLH